MKTASTVTISILCPKCRIGLIREVDEGVYQCDCSHCSEIFILPAYYTVEITES